MDHRPTQATHNLLKTKGACSPCLGRIPACTLSSKNAQLPLHLRRQLSIKLYSVTKIVGPKRFQRTIARNVTWTIEPRSKYVVLGHQGDALAVFANVIAGLSVPTEGWVKREGKISPPGGFLRYSAGGTPLELVRLLAPLYQFDAEQVLDFVAAAIRYDRLLRTPLTKLPVPLRRELDFVLTYAIPCDYYFFGGLPKGSRPEFQKFCLQAVARRRSEASMLILTASERTARSLGSDTKAAILYRGNFTLYEQLDDALVVFEQLEPEAAIPDEALEGETYEQDVDLIL